MRIKMRRIAICLSIVFTLSACGPPQAELDGMATQVAASILSTQSAVGPAPTSTPSPVPPTTFTLQADGSGDYATLAEAVRSVPEGATLILVPGTYRLTGRLYVRKSLHLVGAEMEQTAIVSEAEGYVIRFSGDGPFSAEEITFRHDGEAAASVVVVRGGEVAFTHCRFSGAVAGGARDGVGLWIEGETDGSVQDCVSDENGNIGLLVGGRAQPTLERNRLTDNVAIGIAYVKDAGGVARRNQCSGSMMGISLSGQADPALEQNQCSGNGTGILVIDRARPALEGNVCDENEDSGIRYRDNAGGSASENECSRNGYHGIYVQDQAWPALKGNVCADNEDSGIVYFDNASGLVSENECVGNGKYGIGVQITANPTLMGNDCRDNGLGDIEHTH